MSDQSSALKELLRQQLLMANQRDQQIAHLNSSGTVMEIPETGRLLSSAYEQLRNAAEYSEEHLLLQRAIKRFLKRNLFLSHRKPKGMGNELIVELVQSGYIQGDQFSTATAIKIDGLIEQYMKAHGHLRQAHIEREAAEDWVLAFVSTEIEGLLNPHNRQLAMAYFAYQYFLATIPRDQFGEMADTSPYELCMYIAVHQALLKSDIDIVRHELLSLYKQSPEDAHGFIQLNRQIDELYVAELTSRLKRLLIKHGAPFRILKSLVEERSDVAELLQNPAMFLDAYNVQISREYRQLAQRLNRGLVKSIIFIFITKVIVGLAIEIPYDLATMGYVAVLPLVINLLFPPLYMASLKLGLRPPSSSNAQATLNYIEKLLYGDPATQIQIPVRQRKTSTGAKFVYSLLLLVPLIITVLILQSLDFNIVQMIIFFVFFSTASFLGFRLSQMVRELEIHTRQTGLFTSMRDFFYLPFIVLGQWLSQKYRKINAVARFLDVAIELPLKSLLRLFRQWIRFLHEKHEELY